MLIITKIAPKIKKKFGVKSNMYIDPKVAIIIATDVAKFFAILSAYLMQIATDKPPIEYHTIVNQTIASKP